MHYKKSRYNILVDTLSDGRKLFFNSFISSFSIMDEKCIRLYDNINSVKREELNENDTINLDNMTKLGLIVNSERDELSEVLYYEGLAKFRAGWLVLTIAPTLDCNMACPYCFEKHKVGAMSQQVQDAIIDFTQRHIERYNTKGVSVVWFGGEPLLEIDVIRSLSVRLIAECEAKSINYASMIVTNGYYMTEEISKILKEECKVSVSQITIDGLQETHDKRRKLKDGTSSFDIIVKNVASAASYLQVGVRINVDRENFDALDKLTDYFVYEKKWLENPRFYFSPIVNHAEKDQRCLLDEDFAELNKKYIKRIFENGTKKIANYLYPFRMYGGCMATSPDSFVIDHEGYLYTCWENIGVYEKSIGSVMKEGYNQDEYMKWLALPNADNCLECKFLPICHGGCPNVRLLNDNKQECAGTKIGYINKLKLAYELHISNKNNEEI